MKSDYSDQILFFLLNEKLFYVLKWISWKLLGFTDIQIICCINDWLTIDWSWIKKYGELLNSEYPVEHFEQFWIDSHNRQPVLQGLHAESF